jgi:hypothetical protein
MLSSLFEKLDSFMENTLIVNLQLTGVLSRLACYPQPLLRSLFFHPTLVFEPTVKSIHQVKIQ